MPKTVPVEEAVGMVLPHDITEIREGEFKGRAFKKGHIIRSEDVEHLKRLGKEHIYVLELGKDDIDRLAIGPTQARELTANIMASWAKK